MQSCSCAKRIRRVLSWSGCCILLYDHMAIRLSHPGHTVETRHLCTKIFVCLPVAIGRGGRTAPQQYAHIPFAMCTILQVLARVPVRQRLDQFIGIEKAGARAESTQWVVQQMHAALDLRCIINKRTLASTTVEALDLDATLLSCKLRSE